MELKTAETLAEFESHRQDWDSLIDSSPCGVFMHSAWLVPWLEIYGTDKRWKIFMAWDKGKVVGGLPVISGTGLKGSAGTRAARVAGTLPVDWVNDISFPTSDSDPKEVIHFLWRAVREFCQGDDLFVWDIMDTSDPVKNLIPRPSLAGMGFMEKYYKRYPFLKLSAKFEDTMQNISKKLRKNWRYYIRNLKESKKTYEYEWIDSGRDTDNIMKELYHLHSSRWDDKASHSTDFMSEVSQEFHSRVARSFADKGLLRFSNIKIENKYAAILYGYVYKNKYYAIVHGLDPAWDEFSPGNLVFRQSIEKSGEEGLNRYEFMKGRQRYKMRYCKESVYHVSLLMALNSRGRRVIFFEYFTAFKIWVRDKVLRKGVNSE